MGAARFAAACLAVTWLAACGLAVNGLETGAGDAGPGLDATADVTSADGSYETSSGGDSAVPPDAPGVDTSSSDTGTAGDVVVAETGSVDGCVAKGPESCTNGIDDDCNGLTDCADPACTTQGYACVTPAPNGWDNVAFDATSQAGCPATLTAKNVDVDPMNLSAPATCACSCAPGNDPSCEQGNISATHGPTNQCSSPAANYPANGGNCNGNTTLTVDSFVLAAQPPPAGGSCSPTVTPTVPPTGATKGEVCSGEKAFGAGCTGTQVCALVPAGFTACLHHGGANMACPAGPYSMPHAVGTLQDTRGCGNCGCGTPTATCSPGSWAFYTSNDCSGAVGISLQTNDQCNATGVPIAGASYSSNKFSSTAGSVACGPPTMAPPSTGNATLTGADTICCQ